MFKAGRFAEEETGWRSAKLTYLSDQLLDRERIASKHYVDLPVRKASISIVVIDGNQPDTGGVAEYGRRKPPAQVGGVPAESDLAGGLVLDAAPDNAAILDDLQSRSGVEGRSLRRRGRGNLSGKLGASGRIF